MQWEFRPERGTTDGLFAVMMGLKKRQGKGSESHGMYVDLVKVSGTVYRGALWEVRRKFGMSDRLVNRPV